MNGRAAKDCAESLEDIWSSWPEPGGVPAEAARHAAACPTCSRELDELRALCRRSPRWSEVLPAQFWQRQVGGTRRALLPRPERAAWLWAPALALAAAALMVVARGPAPPAELDVPVEAVEQRDMLEHLDLLEHWDAVAAAQPAGRLRR